MILRKSNCNQVQLLYFPLKLKLALINSIDICNKRQKLIEENY